MMTGQSENVWQTDELLLSSLDGTTVPLMGDTRVRTGAPNSFTLDCSKVTSRNVVTYGWETRQYDGRLVDVHKDGEFLAYTLGGEKSLVRVISRLHQTKGLIRGFTGQVLDICWANISGPVTLACIDESGSLFVYRVVMGPTETEPFSLQRTLLLSYGAEAIRASRFRVRWCFYVPDSDSSTEDSGLDDLSQLLAITHGNEVQIVNVETVIDKHGDQCHYQGLTDGYITLEETSEITALTISPDGSAIAVATSDGKVKFHLLEDFKRCKFAHEWIPHGGKSVNSIVFLDDLKHLSPEAQFWKFALTTADGNRELKLWSCESWTCQQTLRIESTLKSSEDRSLNFQIAIDITSRFVFLSDIHRKSLYLVELVGVDKERRQFGSLSEFPLLQPALSLAIVSSSRRRFQPFSNAMQRGNADWVVPLKKADSDDEDDQPDNHKVVGVHATVMVINPRCLVELSIRYESDTFIDNLNALDSFSSSEFDETFASDTMSDVSRSEIQAASHVLMSPDDFQVTNQIVSESVKPVSPPSPNGSITPVSRTPTHEKPNLWDPRQPSTSPSSQEVTNILSFTAAKDTPNPDGLLTGASLPDRPPTPVTHTFDLMSVASSTQLHPSDSMTQWPRNPMTDGINGDLSANVLKLSMEVERMVAHMQRQEDKTAEMRALLISQNEKLAAQADEIKGLKSALKNSAEQKHINEEITKKLMTVTGKLEQFRPEAMKNACVQAVSDAAKRSLDAGLRDEMKNIVKPWMAQLQQQLMIELSQKLTSTDVALRDNLAKMVKSQPIIDLLGSRAGEIVSRELGLAVKDAIATQFLPSMDSCAKTLFAQLNTTYEKGTKEYLDQLNSHLVETQKSLMRGWEDQIGSALATHMQKMHESLRSMVHEEVSVVVREQQGVLEKSFSRALRSNAPTPVPKPNAVETQQQLDRLLQAAKFNEAFHLALCTSDVANVLHVCAKVSPQQLFAKQPCPLQQPVILSLIQQLSAELHGQTELKLAYLMEALLVLEKAHPLVSQHVGSIMTALQNNVTAYLAANPNSPHQRNLKWLSVTAPGFLRS